MFPFHIIIPARLASTRLARKALLDIHGLPMVVRVARKMAQVGADSVTVATDEDEILQSCQAHKVACVLTDSRHISGTDRVAEAARLLCLPDDAVIVNVQGDEPLISIKLVRAVAALTQHYPVATAAHLLHQLAEIFNPNFVKVVLARRAELSNSGQALYFSRAPIPWHRNEYAPDKPRPDSFESSTVLRHYGVYGFLMSTLQKFVTLPEGQLEKIEALEQLRFLENHIAIGVFISQEAPAGGVDTEEDLARVRLWLATHGDDC